MPRITLKGFIVIPQNDIADVLHELPNHIELTQKETGCLVFNVAQDENDRYRFNVYEEFENIESFEQHQSRVVSSLWGKITMNVERNYSIEGL